MDLHLLSFDIPYPPRYGGVIDVFNKIRALHRLGVRIHLHCFRYHGKTPAPELETYCAAVRYYARPLSVLNQVSPQPFIVRTRRSPELLERLSDQPFPLLFEGLHTTAFLPHPALRDRRKLLRMHNVEWRYYRHLAAMDRHPLRRLYLWAESVKLRRYERQALQHADVILAISSREEQYFKKNSSALVQLVPAFHGFSRVESRPGRGDYAIFHGNLSVPDNDRAARLLAARVFHDLDYPLVVAGRAPKARLKHICRALPSVKLVADPSDAQMDELIARAHLHLLYSFQADGMKIKLLRALYQGRFVAANTMTANEPALAGLCRLADSPEELRRAVDELRNREFTEEDRATREAVLLRDFSDEAGARRIVEALA